MGVSELDLSVVAAHIGRTPRNVVSIPARCICGNPVVVSTSQRLDDGTPFPTFYYLTHPVATANVSTLEAEQLMVSYNKMLESDSALAAAYLKAHRSYISDREAADGPIPEIADISAGGMPTRVKCLHAVVAHSLAVGPGINPFGDLALEALEWSPRVCQCPDLSEINDTNVTIDMGTTVGASSEDIAAIAIDRAKTQDDRS